MTLVNYTYHAAVTDGNDWLSKLRTFALAQGWTSVEYQTNVQWDETAPYTGWIAGTGSFLQLSSTCWGNCDKAIYRFFVDNYDGNEDQLDHGAHTGTAYDTNTTTSPILQNTLWSGWQNHYGTSMPSAAQGVGKMWLFGSQEYIYVVSQFDDYVIATWHLGSIDLYPEHRNRTDCAFWGSSNYQPFPDTRNFAWNLKDPDYWDAGLLPSWDGWQVQGRIDCVYFSGQAQNRADDGASYSWFPDTPQDTQPPWQEENGAYNVCKNVARTYGPNGRRIAFKVDFFARDAAGEGDIVPLGKTPFWIIPFNGLAPGDTITENGISYMCFPFRFTWFNLGFAFRIA
jgi:hypothetical protein